MQKETKYIGNYKILDIIGKGGMAHIYTAIHIPLKRIVVIKEMIRSVGSESRKRFQQEALLGALLNHKNIVPVYDYFTIGSAHYLVMQYIDGMNLAQIIEHAAPLHPRITALIARQICSALVHAHQNNVIHRDIKPNNILISNHGEVKVSDFGVAKGSDSPDLTSTGTVIGTPYYMSPEQASGERLSHLSDIYSLGIVLYEMLTGKKPFSGHDSQAVTAKVCRGKYTSPFTLDPHHSVRLSRIINRAMKKNMKRRYSTAADMLKDLERFLGWQRIAQSESILEKLISDIEQTRAVTTVIKKPRKKRRKIKRINTLWLYILFIVAVGTLILYLVSQIIRG